MRTSLRLIVALVLLHVCVSFAYSIPDSRERIKRQYGGYYGGGYYPGYYGGGGYGYGRYLPTYYNYGGGYNNNYGGTNIGSINTKNIDLAG
ncbi:unnamed protein product [Anisakis simplex]|uniref:Uncharacterized protein n=1 Tax=Anisakis simplex TaxID=6269 RepID=A0A0M3KBZ5_ANISI|nr:unnamed protein product [Anisakis simplex]